ncbi:MAG: amidohydrolase family protein, partial [Chloroflexota bacterium]
MRDGYRIIDCDRHLVEPPDLWTRYVDRPFRHYIGTLVPTLPNPHGLFAGNNAWRGVYKRFQARGWDNVGYLADMDRERVDTAVLFSTAGLGFCWFEDLDAELCDALCRAYNNWLHDYCSLAPERMIGMAMLPLKEPKLAVRELRRAVEELG